VLEADNLTAICEPIVGTIWDLQHLTTQKPPWPVTGRALLLTFFTLFLRVFVLAHTDGKASLHKCDGLLNYFIMKQAFGYHS
jgi:hypothetical protein